MSAAKKEAEKIAESVVVAFKGFGPDWKCLGMQYVVGQTFEHKGPVKACPTLDEVAGGIGGLHACEYPLDVLRYYQAADSKFAEVEQSGTIARHSEDSKIASSRIVIKAEIGLPGLIKAAIEYTMARVTPAVNASNSGERGAASNSGDSGAASNSGHRGAASNSGDSGAASNSGHSGVASNSGHRGAASNSGAHGIAADFSGTGRAKSSASGAIFLVNRNGDGSLRYVFASKVGENGIEANKFYALDESGKPVEAT